MSKPIIRHCQNCEYVDGFKRGDNVSTSIIITAIVCGTLIIFKIFDFVKK